MFTTIKSNIDVSKAPTKPKIVYVTGDIAENTLTAFRKDMAEAAETGQTTIPIAIDTYGGYTDTLWGMVDIIKTCPVEVVTIVNGKAMSAGGALFTCGKRRYCSPKSKIMIHGVLGGTQGKVEDMKVSVAESSKNNTRLLSFMSQNIGKDKGYFKKMIMSKGNTNQYFSATQAKKIGLATHIGMPTFTMSVTANYFVE